MKKLFLMFVVIYVFYGITFSQNNKKTEEVIGSEFRVSRDKEHIEYVNYLKVTEKIKFPKVNGYKLRQYYNNSVKTLSWNYEKVLAKYDFIYSIKPNELWNAGVNGNTLTEAFNKDSVEIDNKFLNNSLTIYHPFFWKTENIENHYTLMFDKGKNTFFLKKYSDINVKNNWWRIILIVILLILASIKLFNIYKEEINYDYKRDIKSFLGELFFGYLAAIIFNVIIGIIFLLLFSPIGKDIYINMFFENERVLLWFARSTIIFLPTFILMIKDYIKHINN